MSCRRRAGGIELCEIQADRRVGRGGAIVRTLESEVDATVQTQLERAREVIRAELGCEEPSDVSGELLERAASRAAQRRPRTLATGASATSSA